MKKHTIIHEKIPTEIFNNALEEILAIDWKTVSSFSRHNPVFKTSITEHLRIHDFPPGTPMTIEALSAIVACKNVPAREKYPAVENLIKWIKETVKCTKEGRIMLVNIISGGEVAEHTDPGLYFQNYFRFHVPFVTSPEVVFYGPNKSDPTHMPVGYLCQLDNRNLHSVSNNSVTERIHMIIDLDTDDERFQ